MAGWGPLFVVLGLCLALTPVVAEQSSLTNLLDAGAKTQATATATASLTQAECAAVEAPLCLAKTFGQHALVTTVFVTPLQTAWKIVGNFKTAAEWTVGTAEATLKAGVQRSPAIGGVTVTHELISYDPERYTITYKILGGTIVQEDKNQMRLTLRAITDPTGAAAEETMMEWEGWWEVVNEVDKDWVFGLVNSLFKTEMAAVAALVAK